MLKAPLRCGMEAVVDLVGGKWKLLILFHLSHRRMRFSELQRHVGDISEKMLSQQLREMVADSILRRIDFKTVPPHVEYEMTAFGRDLGLAMVPICEWGSRNMDAVTAIAEARASRKGSSGRHPAQGGSPQLGHEPEAVLQAHPAHASAGEGGS